MDVPFNVAPGLVRGGGGGGALLCVFPEIL